MFKKVIVWNNILYWYGWYGMGGYEICVGRFNWMLVLKEEDLSVVEKSVLCYIGVVFIYETNGIIKTNSLFES